MKSTLPLLSLVLVFASCTSAYKTGQTPDDVYFSPARPQDEYVRKEKEDKRQYRDDEEAYRDDRYLRMTIRNRRWSGLYDEYYSYNPYYYHYYNSSLYYNSPWNSTSYWNYYYNPYHCSNTVGIPTRTVVPNKPRVFDLSVYNPQNPTKGTVNIKSNSRNYGNSRTYEYNNTSTYGNNTSRSNSGGLREVFGSGNSGSSNTRSHSPSSSSSSSGSSRSSGTSTNAPARKF